uniref:Uncharacterized protein n=1 Tax=Aegilops tauschii subsp. strangulata TaxID=200361 RepID=A0A453BEQ1_AEGTS
MHRPWWGKDYTLDWNSGRTDENPTDEVHRDILIWSKIVRSRPVCRSHWTIHFTLVLIIEVIFRNPRMKITVQGGLRCQSAPFGQDP